MIAAESGTQAGACQGGAIAIRGEQIRSLACKAKRPVGQPRAESSLVCPAIASSRSSIAAEHDGSAAQDSPRDPVIRWGPQPILITWPASATSTNRLEPWAVTITSRVA